jgi:hypothetical protein
MGFFFIVVFWTVIWLAWNLLVPPRLQFDPRTAFVFWLFISNLIQLLLMPLVMVGQKDAVNAALHGANSGSMHCVLWVVCRLESYRGK